MMIVNNINKLADLPRRLGDVSDVTTTEYSALLLFQRTVVGFTFPTSWFAHQFIS
jgi:hypothetical protein